MPHLELTELEAKVGWMILDRRPPWMIGDPALAEAERTLFAKFYQAYRGIPEAA